MISCLPNVCQVTKNTPSRYLESVFLCPGRESNPHGRFGPRDFKSLVSTISPPGPVARANIRNSCDNRIIRSGLFVFWTVFRTDRHWGRDKFFQAEDSVQAHYLRFKAVFALYGT